MKHFEILLFNGHYPLCYECSTIHEAYGCLEMLASWVPGMHLDLDGIMEVLVSMKIGPTRSHTSALFSITLKDGEV